MNNLTATNKIYSPVNCPHCLQNITVASIYNSTIQTKLLEQATNININTLNEACNLDLHVCPICKSKLDTVLVKKSFALAAITYSAERKIENERFSFN